MLPGFPTSVLTLQFTVLAPWLCAHSKVNKEYSPGFKVLKVPMMSFKFLALSVK